MRNDLVLLLDMLLAAQTIQEFVAGMSQDDFYQNRMAQSAVVRELQVIGEAARMVTEEAHTQYSSIAWRKIAGMRNRMIHEYFDIRLEVVWGVIQTDIPVLIQQLSAIVPPDKTNQDTE